MSRTFHDYEQGKEKDALNVINSHFLFCWPVSQLFCSTSKAYCIAVFAAEIWQMPILPGQLNN